MRTYPNPTTRYSPSICLELGADTCRALTPLSAPEQVGCHEPELIGEHATAWTRSRNSRDQTQHVELPAAKLEVFELFGKAAAVRLSCDVAAPGP